MILTESSFFDIRRILARRRRDLGLAQREVAKLMGVDHSTVSILEGNIVRRPNLYMIIRWAEALGYTIDLTFAEKD